MVQLAILCGLTLLFSIAAGRLTGSLACTLAALLLILGNYKLRVISDALFISLLAAFLGCHMLWLATNRLGWMAAASALIGAAIAVRPAGESDRAANSLCSALLAFAASAALHLLLITAVNETKPRLMLDNWPLMVLLAALGWFTRYWAKTPAIASSI